MIEIMIPKLGLTMEKAELTKWTVSSGDQVREGEVLFVIETDKVTFEVPSPGDGFIHPIVPEGSTCMVEETVAYLAADRAEYEAVLKGHPGAGMRDSVREKEPAVSDVSRGAVAASGSFSGDRTDRIKASPLARAMAREHRLSLASIPGTGPGGRIVKADILNALERVGRERPGETGAAETILKERAETIPIRGVRKVIFDNMYQSLSRSAQLTLHAEADAEGLISLRKTLVDSGTDVSFNAILMKVAAGALRSHPHMNASVDGDAVTIWKQVHVGIAMEASGVLVVPVVRNPDLKSIRQIDRDIKVLIAKAKGNSLSPDDLVNGTFTLSNLGFAEVDFFTPIIRPPESAVLGAGRIVRKPVVRDDGVVPGSRIGLSLTFDHRIIDGAPAARFLKTVKDTIENPLLLIC
jgi:pyruvate dehydrogenase E2 component (dihydrolipoyllysine-residue acetyltransferase)